MGKGGKGGGGGYGGPRHTTHGVGAFGSSINNTTDSSGCECSDCDWLRWLCILSIPTWLILMLSLTFYTAPAQLHNDTLYLQTSETRAYRLPTETTFSSSRTKFGDQTLSVKVYQFHTLPALDGSPVTQLPIIPTQIVTPMAWEQENDWLWENYVFNAGSTGLYTLVCTGSPVNVVVIRGDDAQRRWNTALLQSDMTSAHSYCLDVQSNVWSGSYVYTQPDVADADIQDDNVYFAIENPYLSTASCTVHLNITYTRYNLSRFVPVCINANDCVLDADDGAYVILVPPDVPNDLNIYNGPHFDTVQADQYTVTLHQTLLPVATSGTMMWILGGGLVVLLSLCVIVHLNLLRHRAMLKMPVSTITPPKFFTAPTTATVPTVALVAHSGAIGIPSVTASATVVPTGGTSTTTLPTTAAAAAVSTTKDVVTATSALTTPAPPAISSLSVIVATGGPSRPLALYVAADVPAYSGFHPNSHVSAPAHVIELTDITSVSPSPLL